LLFSGNIGQGVFTLALAWSGCNATAAIVFLILATSLNGAVSTGVLANIVDLSPNFASELKLSASSISLLFNLQFFFYVVIISAFKAFFSHLCP